VECLCVSVSGMRWGDEVGGGGGGGEGR